jgi:hypothetical protein
MHVSATQDNVVAFPDKEGILKRYHQGKRREELR